MEAPVKAEEIGGQSAQRQEKHVSRGRSNTPRVQVNAAGDNVKRSNQDDETCVILRRVMKCRQRRGRQNENVIAHRDGRQKQRHLGMCVSPIRSANVKRSTAMQASNSPKGSIIHGVGEYTGHYYSEMASSSNPWLRWRICRWRSCWRRAATVFSSKSVGKTNSGKGVNQAALAASLAARRNAVF